MGNATKVGDRKLVVLSGRAKGTAFVLTKSEVKAGRESDNAICLKGKRVSRHHAVLIRDNGEYTLRDMSPRIGTLLNGRRTKEAHLKVGDRIRIGEFEMRYEATRAMAVAPVIDVPTVTVPAPLDEIPVPVMPVAATPKESAVENSSLEDQRRITGLTQETERLVSEVKLGNEALESVRAQLQTQSELQADLTERLSTMAQENAALAKWNGELQAKVSELKESAEEANRVEVQLTQEAERLVGEVELANEALESVRAELQTQSEQRADLAERLGAVAQEKTALVKWNDELRARVSELEAVARKADRMEVELAVAQAALRQLGEELARARETAKQDVAVGPADQALPMVRVRSVPPEVPDEPDEVSDRIAPAILAKRDVSDPTNEQFDKIRRSIVEKRKQRANMTLLDRFMLPFRDTARLMQEPNNANPE